MSILMPELEAVYSKLQERELHPRGAFDKRGRFYLEDGELVNVRAPSARHPYSEMLAGRTFNFVLAIAEKYRCATQSELESHFVTKN